MTRYTISDFRKRYGTDADWLDKIFQLRYKNMSHCPECQNETGFHRIATRRAYQCKYCYAQFYPTVGTIFEKTRTPLSDWFYIVYLYMTSHKGVTVKEIQTQLGVTYKCALRMSHKITKRMDTLSPNVLVQGSYVLDTSNCVGYNEAADKFLEQFISN